MTTWWTAPPAPRCATSPRAPRPCAPTRTSANRVVGKDAQQGFATAEPYIHQNEVSAWGKEVEYQLVNDAGYP
jgi:hypothetical protein